MQQEQHIVLFRKCLPSQADRAGRISFALETSFDCRLQVAKLRHIAILKSIRSHPRI